MALLPVLFGIGIGYIAFTEEGRRFGDKASEVAVEKAKEVFNKYREEYDKAKKANTYEHMPQEECIESSVPKEEKPSVEAPKP